jgi:hypothetical protein
MKFGLDGRGSNPGRGKIFHFSSVETGSGAHPASYPVGIRDEFPREKAAGA